MNTLQFNQPVVDSDGSIKKLEDFGGGGLITSVGNGLRLDSTGELDLQPASIEQLGGIIVGNGLSIDENGKLSVGGGNGLELVIAGLAVNSGLIVDLDMPTEDYYYVGFGCGYGSGATTSFAYSPCVILNGAVSGYRGNPPINIYDSEGKLRIWSNAPKTAYFVFRVKLN